MTGETGRDPLEDLLLPEERKGYRYDRATREAARSMTYEGARELLGTVLRFTDPTDYDAVLLFAGSTRVMDLLDLVWYLSFAGAKSSGKTTAARVARFLSHHVIEAGQLSAAALPAAMKVARGLLLDEVDVLLKREGGEMIAATLRQGTDRSTPYLKNVDTGGGHDWKLVGVPVFGPKILTFKRTVDDALASRSDLIRMPRARDPRIRRAATRYRRVLLPVKCWLDAEARRALTKWTKAGVDEYLESAEFVGLSDKLQTDLDRTGQIGDLMLLVGHIYEWPTATIVQARLGVIEDASADDTVEEVRRALLAVFASPPAGSQHELEGGGLVLKKSAIKERVDLYRKAPLKPIWANALAEALDELGFERDQRFSESDRDRSIRVRPEDVGRLRRAGPPSILDSVKPGQVGHYEPSPSVKASVPPLRPTFLEGGSGGGTGPDDGSGRPSSPSVVPPPISEVGQPPATDEKTTPASHHPTCPTCPQRERDEGVDPVGEEPDNWTVSPKDRARRSSGGEL